jgi:hypothetical protein
LWLRRVARKTTMSTLTLDLVAVNLAALGGRAFLRRGNGEQNRQEKKRDQASAGVATRTSLARTPVPEDSTARDLHLLFRKDEYS